MKKKQRRELPMAYTKTKKWFEAHLRNRNYVRRRRELMGYDDGAYDPKRSCGLEGDLPPMLWNPNGANCSSCGKSKYEHPPLYSMIPDRLAVGQLCPYNEID